LKAIKKKNIPKGKIIVINPKARSINNKKLIKHGRYFD